METNEEKARNSPIKGDDFGPNAMGIEIPGSDVYSKATFKEYGSRKRMHEHQENICAIGEGSSAGLDQVKKQRGGESYLAGNLKTIPQLAHEYHILPKVTVNGHFILDPLVKKAEKLAGTIQPGNYWYDSRAGFWGVMSGPCLGMIPPFIEEFGYLMPKDCSGGNTRILVNGRELNEEDLNLLRSRGFPTEENKSYRLEISGRILDVDSGQELPSLGKLAPTIEKLKRGFGMKNPKSARDA